LSWLYRMSVKRDQKKWMTIDEKRHWTCPGASTISDAKSVTSSWNDRERAQRNRRSTRLTTSPID